MGVGGWGWGEVGVLSYDDALGSYLITMHCAYLKDDALCATVLLCNPHPFDFALFRIRNA